MSPKRYKKLVSVSATFTPVTQTRKEALEAVNIVEAGKDSKKSEDEYLENLARVLYIWYPITFWKKFVPMLAFFDSGSEINAIYLTFA